LTHFSFCPSCLQQVIWNNGKLPPDSEGCDWRALAVCKTQELGLPNGGRATLGCATITNRHITTPASCVASLTADSSHRPPSLCSQQSPPSHGPEDGNVGNSLPLSTAAFWTILVKRLPPPCRVRLVQSFLQAPTSIAPELCLQVQQASQ